jgi:hypothetical protein
MRMSKNIGTYTDHLIISSTTGETSLPTIWPARNITGTRITERLGPEAGHLSGKIITNETRLSRMSVDSLRKDIGSIGSLTVVGESMMKRSI